MQGNKTSVSRRQFIARSAAVAGPVIAAATAPPLVAAAEASAGRKLKVVCIGAHPDDPESGCGGTLARYAQLGHEAVVVYVTRGERGIRDTSAEEAARIRTREAESACKLLKARPVFFGLIDAATEFTRANVDAMTKLLSAEAPDVVFAHWPIDTHMDHQVSSMLCIRACMGLANPPRLYFFEVDTGDQSQGFFPDTYVDISGVLEIKKKALFAHVSQDGEKIWQQHHDEISKWRGREAGVRTAEAFVHLSRDTQRTILPGISSWGR